MQHLIQHLIQTITALQERKIGFKCLQENIDTSTSGGKLIFHMFSALAEFERDLIRERTEAGLNTNTEYYRSHFAWNWDKKRLSGVLAGEEAQPICSISLFRCSRGWPK